MKRLLTLAAMFLCCMATTFAQFSGSGSGTESDPYLVMNPIQLNQLRNYLNQSGVYFKLMADIDLTEFIEEEYPSVGWQPVGTSSAPFKGVLYGNGHTISGLWINRSSTDDIGFFGKLSGTVNNLTLKGGSIIGRNRVGFLSGSVESSNISDCILEGNLVKGNDNIGLLSGSASNSTINNCILVGDVNGFSNVGGCVGYGSIAIISSASLTGNVYGTNDFVGGIIGQAEGKGSLCDCKVTGIQVSGRNYVGGICGVDLEDDMTSCVVYTSIIGNDYVGGICGRYVPKTSDSNILNCGFVGHISANSYVGGISGEIFGRATINSCFATGNIKATGNFSGGLIGSSSLNTNYVMYNGGLYHDNIYYYYYYYTDIINCLFSGSVSGREQVGGLVGYKNSGSIKLCYSNSTVVGTKSVGGLCGKIEGRYDNKDYYSTLYMTSNVIIAASVKATDGDVGRVYGEIGSYAVVGEMGTTSENKAYNRTIVICQGVVQDVMDDAQNGTGVSATTLKLKATYVAMGWDFTDIWAIQETECYPYFKTQTAPPVITSQVVSGATIVSGKCVDGGMVTIEIDGVKQQKVSSGHVFSFTVNPLQAGHEVRVCAKADGKEQSYFTTETVAYLGKGTEAVPYQVYTASDLTGVYRKGYFKLMNDIDLTDYINQFSPTEGWESIGREGSETIHFDGNGHKITGLWCNSTRDNTGLFSCFANGTIKNLTVKTAKNKQVKGGANTGIIIGKMINGTIENCNVEGTVADGTPVGGMVGLFDGGSISRCQANVTVTTTLETSYVGGLVGETTGGTIDQCFTEGTLTGTGSESYVGGLIGKNSATVTNSYSNAKVSSSYNVAGVVAYNYGVVDKCYATGDLFSNNYAAGVIGYNDGANSSIMNCVAMNNKIDVVYESQQQQQGGGYGQRIIGGIKNNAPAPDMNNYALKTMQVSLNDVPQKVYDDIMNGTGKTAAELTLKATYQTLDWDFDNIWRISEGSGYPYLTGTTAVSPDDPNPGGGGEGGEVETPDTDISSMSNVVYLNKVETSADSQINLSIKMKNSTAIRGFQFDLYLPEGVTVVKSAKGKIVGSLSEGRLPEDDEHTLTLSEQGDGSIRFLCGSLYDETFTGTDGEIATLTVQIAANMEDGNYAIILRNIKLTETDINNYYETDYVKSTLTISSYTLGDINNDKQVDVSDYIGIANHILSSTPEGFNMKAADVNEDGNIDVSDYIGVANIILTGSVYGSSNAPMIYTVKNKETQEVEPE